jgi:hypothetical protein
LVTFFDGGGANHSIDVLRKIRRKSECIQPHLLSRACFQGSTKLSPVLQKEDRVFLFWYKKAVMPKKASYSCTETDKIGPSLPLKTMKSKQENQVLNRDNFVLP